MIDLSYKPKKQPEEEPEAEEIVMGFIAAAIWLTLILGIVRAL